MLNCDDALQLTAFFDGSSQLQMNWLTHNLIIHDFVPEGRLFVSVHHAHPSLELLVVISGDGLLEAEGVEPIPIHFGSLVFVDRDVNHKVTSTSQPPLQTYLVAFELEPRTQTEKIARGWAEDERRVISAVLNAPVHVVQDNGNCMLALNEVISCIQTKRLGELVIIKNHMSSLVMCAFQQFAKLPPRGDFVNTLRSTPTLSTSRIVKYVQEHFTEKITIASVAEALHYSQRQCQRVICNNLGISFTDLLTDFRLSYGKELLVTTDESIERIAEMAGFKSGKSFSWTLREREGVTPYRYRKQARAAADGKVKSEE